MDSDTVVKLEKALRDQGDFWDTYNKEALLGADPTGDDQETIDLKNQSRGSWGNVILSQYQNATRVSSISEDAQVSDLMTQWRDQRMDQKLRHIVRDRKVGGVAYVVAEKLLDGTVAWKVRNPQEIVVLVDDFVNDEYPSCAMYRFTSTDPDGTKATYAYVYDAVNRGTWRKDGSAWELVPGSEKPHGSFACPVIPFYDMMTSDGKIHSLIELISPGIKDLRQKSANLADLTYWNSLKMLFIIGMAAEQVELDGTEDPDFQQTVSTLNRIKKQIRAKSSTAVDLPYNEDNPAAQPKIEQTQEGNLMQMIEVVSHAKNNLASLASLQVGVFDAGQYAQNPEAAVEASRLFASTIDADELVIDADLHSLFRITDAMTGTTREIEPVITWQPATPATGAVVADQVSKFSAAGYPAKWIAKYGTPGYTPEAISELVADLAAGVSQGANTDVSFGSNLEG